MKNILITSVISLFITSIGFLSYDYIRCAPKFMAMKISVVDIDKLIKSSADEVLQDKISLGIYQSRIALAEELIRQEGLVLSRYITINNTEYPLVFGGSDITENVLERMGALK